MLMKKSPVYFADLRADTKRNLLDKIDALLISVGIKERFKKGNLVAVKMHFGEKGNTSYIQPVFVRRVIERLKETGASPFLTDTNTLYVGTRGNAVDHLRTAVENGFAYSVVGAPVIIADGLRGEGALAVKVEGRHYSAVNIAREVVNASGIVALTHFKCHEMCGFGGTLKNIGMGCASREGKLAQHSNSAPRVDPSGCTACAECALVCPADAIDIGNVAVIKESVCIGCGHCIAACPEGAIHVQWNETAGRLQEKMAEHVKGALAGKEDKCVFMNFIMRVSPLCDCYGHNDSPIVPDIGILSSVDPVALDQASADIVNDEAGFRDTALKSGHERGGDKFRGVHPQVDWRIQLITAEELGLGRRAYEIKKV